MEARRMAVWIGAIVLLLGLAVLVYFDYRPQQSETPAPAEITTTEAASVAETGPAGDADAVAAGDVASSEPAAPTGDEPVEAAEVDASAEPAPPTEAAESAVEAAEGAPAAGEGTAEVAETIAEAAPTEVPTVAEEAGSGIAGEMVPETDAAALAGDDAGPVAEVPGPEIAAAPEPASPVIVDEAPEVAGPDTAAGAIPAPRTDEPAVAAPAPEAIAEEEQHAAKAEPAPDPTTGEATAVAPAEEEEEQQRIAAVEPEEAADPGSPDAADAPDAGMVVEAVPEAALSDEDVLAEIAGEADADAPSFDVVRVEPTGDAVIAGLAPPGSTVELMSNGDAIATAEANERGEWAMALLDPLPPGPHDLAIRTTSPDRDTVLLSDQRIAVMVPDSPTEEPLVVLNAPDAASTIMQLPAPPPAAALPPEVAAAPEIEGPAGTVIAAAPAEASDPAAAEETAIPEETGEVTPAVAETEPEQPGDEREVASVEIDVPAEAAPPPAIAIPTHEAEPPAVVAAPVPGEGSEAAAVAETVAPGPGPEEADVAIAGPEAAGEVDVALAPAEGPPAEVEAPAEIAVAEPEVGPEDEIAPVEAEVAAVEPELSPEPEVAAAPEPEPEPEVVAVPVIEPDVVVIAVEAETTGALFIAGTATTPEPVRVYMDDRLLGEVKPSPSGTWLLETRRDLPAGTYAVRADQVEAGTGSVVARAEVPFEREVEVAVLRPVGEAGGPAGAEATGSLGNPQTVIIKRRDNLWRISRQLYGKGIRWSTIYQANKDQIRNPRWIYPGQVFVLPEGNVAWEDGRKSGSTGLQ